MYWTEERYTMKVAGCDKSLGLLGVHCTMKVVDCDRSLRHLGILSVHKPLDFKYDCKQDNNDRNLKRVSKDRW